MKSQGKSLGGFLIVLVVVSCAPAPVATTQTYRPKVKVLALAKEPVSRQIETTQLNLYHTPKNHS